jgi:23S rRNA pseudouridine955/2504/2580 synthase
MRPEATPRSVNAVTEYKTLHNLGLKATGSLSLLGLYPVTGRKHQLRVHCASVLNCAVLGDYRYGNAAVMRLYRNLGDDRGRVHMHLHHRELSFTDQNGKKVKITAKLIGPMKETFRELGVEERDIPE